ncbi:MAG TPA: hypothetical protein VFG87_30060 [Amycolatopsis sp.]|nr:hypothetical protein [Amycolatopsis sp.]
MDFESVADELFAAPREEFTALRDRRVRQARPDRELARNIASLRKPTVAAWLVNLLSRAHPAEVERLARVGGALRQAHQDLAGDELRTLSRQRHALIEELSARAGQLARQAGHPFGDATFRQVEETFEAIVLDARAAEAVRAARLSTALAPGASQDWLTAATAPPRGRTGEPGTAGKEVGDKGAGAASAPVATRPRTETARRGTPGRTRAAPAEPSMRREREREREKARQEAKNATRAREEARRALAKAEREADNAAAAVARLRERLAEAVGLERDKKATVTAARKACDAAERAARAADERLGGTGG